MISDYFRFLAHQLEGWPQQNYYLFLFSLGCQVMTLISTPITRVTIIIFTGTALGVPCALATNTAKSVNGLLGILSALCFIIAGFSAKNYSSIAEQITYVITPDLPVLPPANWNVSMASKTREFNARPWAVATIATIIVYLISSYLVGYFTDGPRPWIGAIGFSTSLFVGIICFLCFNNQYSWWLVPDLA